MAKRIIKLQQNALPTVAKQKVAAYVRVSEQSEDLLRSYARQVDYYKKLITSNPEWEFAGVFADKGISGTLIEKRDSFNEMLDECNKGNIDIILTKSISRFARNTVDLLETVRHLKNKDIEVRFEKENINSLSGDDELMLSILASFAQEESRSISENVKWGIGKKNEKGIIASGMRRLFGYKPVDGEYVVVEKESEIVRRIFNMFNNGFTVPQICRILNSEGLKTQTGREFLDVNVDYLLKNEMYIGDRLTYKYYTENSLTHRCVRNHGEIEQLYIQGDHAAIVDEDVFYKAQEMMKKRSDAKIISHPFTNLIFFGYCGTVVYKKAYPAYTTYACKSKTKNRNSCIMKRLNEVVLYDIAAKAMRITVFDPFKVREQIKKVTIYNDRIEIEMQNGGQSTWQR